MIKCGSMKNTNTMIICNTSVKDNITVNLCKVHRNKKLIHLKDGTILKNIDNNYVICRNKIFFWEIIQHIDISRLRIAPASLDFLRNEKNSYLKEELKRLDVSINIKENRCYWFINILYFLGNFSCIVKKIQRYYRNTYKLKIKKRKDSIKLIRKYYLNYKLKKLLPILIKNGTILKIYNCINICDPITQETFMEVSTDRWVICNYENKSCWWFDIVSAVQLLGSPGCHSGENPFNRMEYPPEFLFDVEEKLDNLKNKYTDVMNLINVNTEYYCYSRFQNHIKANKVFESFKEIGYIFPRNIFLKYSLNELRKLCLKIYESWNTLYSQKERFFPDGIYPTDISNLINSSSSILLKTTILDSLLISIKQENYNDRLYSCLKALMILGKINDASHKIIKDIGLCNCRENNAH